MLTPYVNMVIWSRGDMKNIMQRNRKRPAKRTFIARVSNDAMGRFFIEQLKQNLNSNSYSLNIKASGRRDKGMRNTRSANATSFRVYLQAKTPTGLKQIDRNKVEVNS